MRLRSSSKQISPISRPQWQSSQRLSMFDWTVVGTVPHCASIMHIECTRWPQSATQSSHIELLAFNGCYSYKWQQNASTAEWTLQRKWAIGVRCTDRSLALSLSPFLPFFLSSFLIVRALFALKRITQGKESRVEKATAGPVPDALLAAGSARQSDRVTAHSANHLNKLVKSTSNCSDIRHSTTV